MDKKSIVSGQKIDSCPALVSWYPDRCRCRLLQLRGLFTFTSRLRTVAPLAPAVCCCAAGTSCARSRPSGSLRVSAAPVAGSWYPDRCRGAKSCIIWYSSKTGFSFKGSTIRKTFVSRIVEKPLFSAFCIIWVRFQPFFTCRMKNALFRLSFS